MPRHGDFVWADMACFDAERAARFYTAVLGWQIDQSGLALCAGRPVAQLGVMPEALQARGLPAFWMSVIAVGDVAQAVALALDNGGRVEVGPVPYGNGSMALVRDPLGAGFTLYDGQDAAGASIGVGARAGHGLFVSDVGAVSAFYAALFGWQFGPVRDGVAQVSLAGDLHFYAHEISDAAVRGTEEFWAVYYRVADLEAARPLVKDAGGQIEAAFEVPEGPVLLVRDPDGAAVFLVQDGRVGPRG